MMMFTQGQTFCHKRFESEFWIGFSFLFQCVGMLGCVDRTVCGRRDLCSGVWAAVGSGCVNMSVYLRDWIWRMLYCLGLIILCCVVLCLLFFGDVCVCVYICLCVFLCVFLIVCVFLCMCVFVCVSKCLCVFMCLCVFCLFVFFCVYIYICVLFVCECVHICACGRFGSWTSIYSIRVWLGGGGWCLSTGLWSPLVWCTRCC